MSSLYLVDGNSYLYRAFYAIRGLTASDGTPTNAIFGFTNMLLKILRERKPDYFAIVFDAPGPTYRHEAYEKYKAHRPGMPGDLRPQVPLIKEIIGAFNIPAIERAGYEADDILAHIARRAESEEIDVYIVTGDKDMCQVVSPKIRLYDTMKDRVTEEKDVREKYGVSPARFPEVIALMGDSSDNIPGAPGIGEKTAVKLLQEFGSLQDIIDSCSNIKNARVRNAVSENIDNIRLSLELATLHPDVPVDIPLNELGLREPDWKALLEHFRRYGFSSLIKLIPEESVRGDTETAEYVTILEEDVLEASLARVRDEVTIDTETTSPSPTEADLVGLSFASDPKKAYYIPFGHEYGGAPQQLSKKEVLQRIKGMMENPATRKTGHNIKYDLIVLRNEGIAMKGIAFDTMVASYLLNPGRATHSLTEAAMEHLGIKKLSYSDVVGKGRRDFRDVPVEEAAHYSGEDSAVTLRLRQHFEPRLEKEGLEKLFHEIEMPLIEVLADMEVAGVRIDLPLMKSFSERMSGELSSIEQRIYFIAGEEFNINSPKQLQEILFDKLGLKPTKRTKTGFSTNIDVLEQLALQHELPREIIEYRGLSKLKNTYVDALPRLVNPRTGRVHTSFNQTITATGRLSSSDPNLQNIPIRGEWGTKIRAAFIADAGNLLLSADYSQIELRVFAHLSGDELLAETFRKDGDIHTRTACELFGVAPGAVTADMRRSAKTVNFGIVYGISPFGLSQQLGIPPDEARSYIDTYFARHSGVKDYIQRLIEDASENGFVTTILGRKRPVPELKSTNRNIRQFGERLATNTPIQGSAADIIKVAMLNIWNRLRKEDMKTRMLLQVHDELLLEVPEEEKEAAGKLVREEMERAVSLSVPLKVDMGIGKNWAEAH
ncbi:MAG: DNA polymerase I [Nitrospiraceae bacterium]|nr:MAG: DNA polymerase I [Nitrospiraceae bacterium]